MTQVLEAKSFILKSASVARRGMKSLPIGTMVWGVYHPRHSLWFYYGYDNEYAAKEVAAKLGTPDAQNLACNFRARPPIVITEYQGR